MCLDAHDELTAAWDALVAAGFPPKATRIFFDVEFVEYEKAVGYVTTPCARATRSPRSPLGRRLTAQFRSNYNRSANLARQGR